MTFDLTTAGIAANARSQADMLAGVISPTKASPGDPVRSALLDVAVAVEKLEDMRATTANMLSDPKLGSQDKYGNATTVMGAAYKAASASVDALERALDTARTATRKTLLGGNVPAVDSPLAQFTAEQITKALEHTADGGLARTDLLAKYLRDAQVRDDAVTIDVILNRLHVVYDRLGIQPELIYRQLARVVQQSPVQDADMTDNAALLALLERGGSGSLNGLVVAARYTLSSDQEGYTKWLAGMLRDGQLRGAQERGVPSGVLPLPDGGTAQIVSGGLGGPVPAFTRPPRGGTFGGR